MLRPPSRSTPFPYTTLFRSFENAHVPKESLVGTEGEGFEYAKKMLYGGRVTVGAISTGIARAAFDNAVRYSKDRDRKSTRLNASHRTISYAVFCLKRKKKT